MYFSHRKSIPDSWRPPSNPGGEIGAIMAGGYISLILYKESLK